MKCVYIYISLLYFVLTSVKSEFTGSMCGCDLGLSRCNQILGLGRDIRIVLYQSYVKKKTFKRFRKYVNVVRKRYVV